MTPLAKLLRIAPYGLIPVSIPLPASISKPDPTTPAAIAAEPIVISGSPQRIWVDSGFGYTVDLIDGIMSIVNVD